MSSVEFRGKIAAFADAIERRPEQAVRVIALNLLRSMVMGSPVDTGRFRGNWNVQYDAAPQQTNATDSGGTATIARGLSALQAFKLGMAKVFVLNHLPYSIPLEYGHSRQAPQGMVRLTVQRFDEFMRRVKEDDLR